MSQKRGYGQKVKYCASKHEKRKFSRSTAAQIKFLVNYMAANPAVANEKHLSGKRSALLDNEWTKLKNLLKNYGPDKSLEQWRHSWRDLKKKAREDFRRIREATLANASDIPELSEHSRMVLETIGEPCEVDVNTENPDNSTDDEAWTDRLKKAEQNGGHVNCITMIFEPEKIVKEEKVYLEDEEDEPAETNFKFQNYPEDRRAQKVTEKAPCRKRSPSPSTSTSSRPEKDAKKNSSSADDILDTLNKFMDYEREKNKAAHDREMKRIAQNNKVLNLLGRMVNVFETLAPKIQNFLDQNIDEDR